MSNGINYIAAFDFNNSMLETLRKLDLCRDDIWKWDQRFGRKVDVYYRDMLMNRDYDWEYSKSWTTIDIKVVSWRAYE